MKAFIIFSIACFIIILLPILISIIVTIIEERKERK